MTEETQEQDAEAAVSEQPQVEQQEAKEEQMVPLAALQAERRKRQDSEAKALLYQESLMRMKEQPEEVEEENPNELVEKKFLKETNAANKREILETLYQDMNPEAVQKINKYLKQILEKKPWLAASVDTAQNRYARAHEIVNDYMHLVEPKTKPTAGPTDGQRIVANSQKPGSTAQFGKSAQPTGADYLKSIQGKKEFREYRARLLRGET